MIKSICFEQDDQMTVPWQFVQPHEVFVHSSHLIVFEVWADRRTTVSPLMMGERWPSRKKKKNEQFTSKNIDLKIHSISQNMVDSILIHNWSQIYPLDFTAGRASFLSWVVKTYLVCRLVCTAFDMLVKLISLQKQIKIFFAQIINYCAAPRARLFFTRLQKSNSEVVVVKSC